ncbi:M6 family metalloprotease domain-containing protein [Nonomuraea sp. K274]|uniref:M6 family metalloprotease domain-containing protein n=1 Tax=Nonomuraea cypriaca TaxID=1187855 RepID=A0A931EZ68_9ACTN|nr:M6 family metalloprotease domain-containing protein [Nonomuraea cypriaca]MBF8188045.1 M6 family metalloprotease domain-containing protein [Nonomuraea cypriaca]
MRRIGSLLGALLLAAGAAIVPATAAVASTEPAVERVEPAQGCVLPGAAGVPAGDDRKRWWGDEGRETDGERFVRPVGTIRAVMLFVDFPNARAENNAAPYDTTAAYHDFLAPSADWFRRSSSGRLDLRISAVPKWFRMPLADSEYGIARDMPLRTQTRYIRQAVELADADVDFSDYDLVYVVPSRNAANIPLSPAYVNGGDDRIAADGTWVDQGVTFGRDMWNWGFKILVHETGHTFGLPDLYVEPGDTHAAVRGWDLMGNIGGRQPEFLAWHKLKLDWLRDGQIDCVTEAGTTRHRIGPVERAGGGKAVVVRTGETTAYVIESRRPIGHDTEACSSGVLVYAIDSRLRSGQAPVRIIDASPGSTQTATCHDLDIATLRAGAVSALTLPDGTTVEVVRESNQLDTVVVTKRR